MSSFAELSVFNKMLLEKMQRMEEEHKKQISKLRDVYYSLVEIATDNDHNEFYQCTFCDKWFDANAYPDDDVILDYDNGEYCCPECEEQGIGYLKKCVDCDDVINLDCGHKWFHKRTRWGVKYGSDAVCKQCNRIHLYPAVDESVFSDYDEVVGKIQSLVGTMTVANKIAGLPDTNFKPSWMDTYYK